MPEEEFQAIYGALSSVHPHIKSDSIAAEAKTLLKTDIPDFDDIVQVLSGMNASRAGIEIALDQLVRDATAALLRWNRASKPPQHFDAPVFEKRLVAFLSIETLILSARALDVQHEYEHVFQSARILTDLRPIFNAAGSDLQGAIIVHNLKITYYAMGEYREAFFALDNSDLITLRKILERAETKTTSLEALATKADVPYFESK